MPESIFPLLVFGFGITGASIPCSASYTKPKPIKINHQKTMIKTVSRLQISLTWFQILNIRKFNVTIKSHSIVIFFLYFMLLSLALYVK